MKICLLTSIPDGVTTSYMNLSKLLATLESEPTDPYRPSMALIAHAYGEGVLLDYTGTNIEGEVDMIGYALGDLGLDDAPDGLSVWEGRYHYDPGFESDHGPPEPSSEPVGAFRALTPDEWARLARDGVLWDDDGDAFVPANDTREDTQ
jgi:hypothetical protein